MKATYLDSQIAELVMRTMQEDGIVALPIHDSFFVLEQVIRRWLDQRLWKLPLKPLLVLLVCHRR